MTTVSKLVAISGASLLTAALLTGCGSDTSDNAESTQADLTTAANSTVEDTADDTTTEEAISDETTTVTEQPTVTETAAQPTDSDGGMTDEERRVALQEDFYNQLSAYQDPIGQTITFDGVASKVCIHGDSHALNVVTAGPNTSCDFAKAVFQGLSTDITADKNIRDYLPAEVQATSPVTEQSYTMNCASDARNLIKCTGGDNATVFMY